MSSHLGRNTALILIPILFIVPFYGCAKKVLVDNKYASSPELRPTNARMEHEAQIRAEQLKDSYPQTTDQLKSQLHALQSSSLNRQGKENGVTKPSTPPKDLALQRAKSDCGELYKSGTKAYGKCVMELLD